MCPEAVTGEVIFWFCVRAGVGIWSGCILEACRGESQAVKLCSASCSLHQVSHLDEARLSPHIEPVCIICDTGNGGIAEFLRLNNGMPSPVGHALGGLAAGWMVGGRGTPMRRAEIRQAALFAAAGMAADLDLLFGAHSGPSHGLGAAGLAGLLAYLATRRGRFAAAVVAASASHTLLDWLGSDVAPPIGIMALWPFSREYYESSVHVFQAISRRYWLPDFWTLNLRAVVRELIVLGPIATLMAYARRRAW